MIAYKRNRALKTLEKKGDVLEMHFLTGSGPNSREREKLQGVPSVHGVQCHSQLEDAGDIVLTENKEGHQGTDVLSQDEDRKENRQFLRGDVA
jgi:hypothetical protein